MGVLLICMLVLALFMQTYYSSINIQKRTEQQGVVYIQGNKQLAGVFSRVLRSAGYKVIIIGEDSEGARFKIRQDTEPPQVWISSPANNTWVTGNTTLFVEASDNTSLSKIILYIDGTQEKVWDASGSSTWSDTYYWDTTKYTDGSHNITVWANDTAGNTNKTYYNYMVDNTPPIVDIISPANNSDVGSTFWVNWTVSDSASGISRVEVYLNGSRHATYVEGINMTNRHRFDGLIYNANYIVEVAAYDNAGLSNSSKIIVHVSLSMEIISPGNWDAFNTSWVLVNWSYNGSPENFTIYRNGSLIDTVYPPDTSYNITGFYEGVWNITLVAKASGGEVAIDCVMIYIDFTAPNLAIVYPIQDGYVSMPLTAEWSGNDSLSGIDHYEVLCYNTTWNSSWINVGTSTTYTFMGLSEGQYAIRVKAYDRAGNTNTSEVTFYVDNTAPYVEIVVPGNNSIVGGIVTINITSSDPHNHTTWLEVNGSVIAVWSGAGNFTYDWDTSTLSDGVYEVVAYANDTASNIGSYRILLVIDNTAPTVKIVTPENNSVVGGVIFINVTSRDIHNHTTWLEIDGDIVAVWLGAGNFSFELNTSTLSDGNHTIILYANDTIGNVNSYRVIITVDNTVPTIQLSLSPLYDSEYVSGIVTISVNSSDPHGNATWLIISCGENQTWAGVGDFFYLWNTTKYVDGSYNISAYANDTVGNIAHVSIVVIVDNTPPTVEISAPANNSTVGMSFRISWSHSDATSRVVMIEIYLNDTLNTTYTEENMTDNHIFHGLATGCYNVSVIAHDVVGLRGADSIIVYVVPMNIIIVYPEYGQPIGTRWVNVSWDASGSIDHFEIYLNGSLKNDSIPSSARWYNVSGLSVEGAWNITVVAVGSGGEVISDFVIIHTDFTPPTISFVYPSQGSVVGGTVTVEIDVSDKYFDRLELYINGSLVAVWTSAGINRYDWDTTVYADGPCNLTSRAYDVAGNVGILTISVVIDNTPPTVTIYSPHEGEKVRGTVMIVFFWNDTNPDYGHLYIDGTVVFPGAGPGNNTYNWNTTMYLDGEHTINITAFDKAGNSASYQIVVVVGNPPVIVIDSPANGSVVGGVVTIDIWSSDRNGNYTWLVINGSLVEIWEGVGTNRYEWNTTSYNEAVFIITVYANDTYGNTNNVSIIVTVDNVLPHVEIVYPSMGAVINRTTITVCWSTSDNIGIRYTGIRFDSGRWHNVTGLFNYTVELQYGTHIVYIKAVDLAGNQEIANVSFRLVPIPSVMFKTSGWALMDGYFNTSTITLLLTITAYGSFEVFIWINGTSIKKLESGENITEYSIQIDIAEIMGTEDIEGCYIIRIYAKDEYGSTGWSRSMIIYVDFTEPEIIIDSPKGGSTIYSDYVIVKGRASDGLSGIFANMVQAKIDDGDWINVSLKDDSFEFVFAKLTGEHTIYVRAFDRAGNRATDAIKVTMVPKTPQPPIARSVLLFLITTILTMVVILVLRRIRGKS